MDHGLTWPSTIKYVTDRTFSRQGKVFCVNTTPKYRQLSWEKNLKIGCCLISLFERILVVGAIVRFALGLCIML